MLVCNQCFKIQEKCTCHHSFLVEIDDNIYLAIKRLNQLGYRTKFCCEGHATSRMFEMQAYIYFDWGKEIEVFKNLPEGWKYDSYNYRKIKHYKYNIIRSIITDNKRQFDKLTEEQKKEIINRNLNNLNSWVENLTER